MRRCGLDYGAGVCQSVLRICPEVLVTGAFAKGIIRCLLHILQPERIAGIVVVESLDGLLLEREAITFYVRALAVLAYIGIADSE